AADGEPFAALRTAPLEHEPPVLGAHAHEESVRLLPVTRIGLKRAHSLGHEIPSRRRAVRASARQTALIEPLMLSNGFRECQSTGAQECATVGVLLWPVPAAVDPCSFGLSPEFSTPVEKTVENRGEAEPKAVLHPDK